MPLRFLAALLILTACAEAPDDTEVVTGSFDAVTVAPDVDPSIASPDVEECDADVFRQAIGVDISTTAFTPSDNVRIFSEADLVTQEYLPKRTNIVTDTNGIITRVYCG